MLNPHCLLCLVLQQHSLVFNLESPKLLFFISNYHQLWDVQTIVALIHFYREINTQMFYERILQYFICDSFSYATNQTSRSRECQKLFNVRATFQFQGVVHCTWNFPIALIISGLCVTCKNSKMHDHCSEFSVISYKQCIDASESPCRQTVPCSHLFAPHSVQLFTAAITI